MVMQTRIELTLYTRRKFHIKEVSVRAVADIWTEVKACNQYLEDMFNLFGDMFGPSTMPGNSTLGTNSVSGK